LSALRKVGHLDMRRHLSKPRGCANHIQKTPGVKGIRHFILFGDESMADKAKELAAKAEFECEVWIMATDLHWPSGRGLH